MQNKGFTLIELVVVIVILGVLAVVAAPKFIDLQKDADQAVMQAMKASIKSAETLVTTQVYLRPDSLNNRQNRFTLTGGQVIRIRGGFPDGLWDDTFVHLLDFEGVGLTTSRFCTDNTLTWCIRERGQGWFNNRGYSNLGAGRGFIIFPYGNDVNRDRCYVYYMNQNANALPDTVNPAIVGVDFSEC